MAVALLTLLVRLTKTGKPNAMPSRQLHRPSLPGIASLELWQHDSHNHLSPHDVLRTTRFLPQIALPHADGHVPHVALDLVLVNLNRASRMVLCDVSISIKRSGIWVYTSTSTKA
jgi:hypothetical protein